ncbi:MAG: hypothetical protein M1553_01225 [Firmicutes bacterium]|nr:hypothetical protein [Bacillota bacterium]
MAELSVWIAALGTLAVLSFVIKENSAYRVAESLLIGTSAAHAFVMGVINIRRLAIAPLLGGRWLMIIPIIIGILLFTRLSRKLMWLSLYPIALIVGLGLGMTLRGAIFAQFLSQVKATMLPLNSVNNLIIIVGTTAVLLFFFFTREREGLFGSYVRFGRWIMMIAFGATFGDSVMMAMTLLIGRLQFLYGNWLKLM